MDEEHKIVITFNADGSTFYTMEVSGNVYPGQFGMLAEDFRYQAVRMKEDARAAHLIAEQERQQRDGILTPARPGVKGEIFKP